MFIVAVDADKCISCAQCTQACPAQILVMDGKAQVAGDPSECLGCQTCATVCPNEAISVEEY